MTIKKLLYRIKSDSPAVLGYRAVFFILRKILELERGLHFLLAGRGRKLITRTINGYKLELDLSDKGLARDLFFSDIREPRHTKLMSEIISPGDTVLDIGANIGYYALLESRLVGENGTVYAIEPVIENFKNLKNNLKLNRADNVISLNIAAGDKDGQGKIYLSAKRNWCSMRAGSEVSLNGKFEEIEVTTVDSFVNNKKIPDLIRMDVEGYEVEIISGMKKIIASGAPLKIIIELHCFLLPDRGTGIVENLLSNGFKIERLFRECPPLMLNKSERLKKIYYYLGKKINGVYEFCYENVSLEDYKKLLDKFKQETVHVYFARK